MTNIDLNKIKLITFIFIPSFIVSVICPGILFVFMFGKDLFINTDTIKLTLLSISVSFPIWFINSIFVYYQLYYNSDEELENDHLQFASILGSFMTIPVIYLPIVVKLFCEIPLQAGVMISFATLLLILLIIYIVKLKRN
ncbi:hypothetical protein EZL74_12455 [Flavobacterium silvisoli]|uniref:Uncharacterized protein n=1 Tax=Flavobacterium silvisoli TaxID=2529433 RepID=A0A4Q9YP83_9FLAO|nr:hypothetical protein [Flavobacterium silvisoli]TBX65197.1 hypothetical protein EZL74_12455 [Flavobacterium silvisoli]